MDYQIYQLEFSGEVHFGNGTLDMTASTISADTLFSALFMEALGMEEESTADRFLQQVKAGNICFSDAFPYIGKEWYLPKPFIPVARDEKSGDSTIKKKYKKMKYIPVSFWKEYLAGDFPVERAEDTRQLGSKSMKMSASVRGNEETLPYRIEVFRFKKDAGLYVIAGYETEYDKELLNTLFERLSLSGLGGKRYSGLGGFECRVRPIPDLLRKLLEEGQSETAGERYMSLSVCLPKEEELENALEDADYQVMKRSGFVSSDRYAPEQMRKRDLYVFAAGSCFSNRFTGDVYDVSDGGRHPVYRYAKPMFLGVKA